MSHSIAPHEPEELLVDSVDEVFEEVEASQKRWAEWEHKHQFEVSSHPSTRSRI